MIATTTVKDAVEPLERMRAIAMSNGWFLTAARIDTTIKEVISGTF